VEQEGSWDFIWLAFDGRIGHVVLAVLAVMSVGAVATRLTAFDAIEMRGRTRPISGKASAARFTIKGLAA
jgi:hypothetical protein